MSAAAIFVQYNDYDKAVNLLSSGVDACEKIDNKESKEKVVELTKKIDEINDLMFDDEYNTLYLDAKTAYEEGDFEMVLNNYNQCLLKNKNDARLYILMAKAYFDENKYTEAIQTLDMGIKRLKSIGAYKKKSKQYNNYIKLTKLKKDYSKIQKVSDKYATFYKELLLGCKKLKNNNNVDKIKNVILKNDFKTIAGCNKVTYYTDKGMYVESFNSGMGIAVYNTGYIYYGEWKDGEKSGDGYYLAISKKEDDTLIYYYHGKWNGDYPNGTGKIVYECYVKDELKVKTVTEGTFINGFEEGQMILKKKTSDSQYGELTMKYKCNKGQPIVIKENGKMKKSADGTFIIGYYYDKDKKKREIASIPTDGEQPKKILWAVSGLQK
jgi:tetratricopeptide (TPR) repeat protein